MNCLKMGAKASRSDIAITFDGPQTFTAGSVVRGDVILMLKGNVQIGAVSAEVIGEGQIYSNKKILCAYEQTIYKAQGRTVSSPKGKTLGIGTYRFPFIFEIPPKGIPSSNTTKKGYIKYHVKAKTSSSVCKREFQIVSEYDDLNHIPETREPLSGMIQNGSHSIEVSILKTGFVPGEKIPISFLLERPKTGFLGVFPSVRVGLYLAIKCAENKGFLTSKVCLRRKKIRLCRKHGLSCSRSRHHIHVPSSAIPSSSFGRSDSPMQLYYFLSVKFHSRSINLPITIGKVKLRSVNESHDFDNDRCTSV